MASAPATSRLLGKLRQHGLLSTPRIGLCASCSSRKLSQTARRRDKDDLTTPSAQPTRQQGGLGAMAELLRKSRAQDLMNMTIGQKSSRGQTMNSILSGVAPPPPVEAEEEEAAVDPGSFGREYNINIFTHKHNTHITVSKPNRDAILSLSTGNIGFKGSKRGTFDAAYQLGVYAMNRLTNEGWHQKIKYLGITFRGFGQGRDAMSKVLLGNEGRLFRDAIRHVSDGTRLKFGGTRSKRPRRL
jgi:small subunit ribosomal protein S11